MKKLSFIAATAVLAAFASCTKVPEIPVVDVAMSSFGFEKEFNSALKADYIVETPTSAFTVAFPYGISEDAVKALIPTFSVTEGATVTVDDKVIESGKTELDFTYPVEFLVTVNEKSNAQYTVTVKIEGAPAWSKKAESTMGFTSEPAMALTPDGENLYVFGYDSDSHPVMLSYKNGALSQIGETSETEEAKYIACACSPDGVPYAAFWDSTAKQMKVYAYKNGKATAVGDPSAILQPTGNSVGSTTVVPISENNVYLFLYSNKADETLGIAKRGLNVCHYDGESWTQGVSLPDWGGNQTYNSRMKWIDGIPYIFILDYKMAQIYIYKHSGNKWITVCKGVSVPTQTEEEGVISSASFKYGAMNFDVASNGDIYFATAANYKTEKNTNELGVVKYDIATQKVSVVGNIMSDLLDSKFRYLSMALSDNDVPFVVYGNTFTELPAYITYIDSKTKTWASPVPVESKETQGIDIQFGADGVGYIVYMDNETKKYVVCTNEAVEAE